MPENVYVTDFHTLKLSDSTLGKLEEEYKGQSIPWWSRMFRPTDRLMTPTEKLIYNYSLHCWEHEIEPGEV